MFPEALDDEQNPADSFAADLEKVRPPAGDSFAADLDTVRTSAPLVLQAPAKAPRSQAATIPFTPDQFPMVASHASSPAAPLPVVAPAAAAPMPARVPVAARGRGPLTPAGEMPILDAPGIGVRQMAAGVSGLVDAARHPGAPVPVQSRSRTGALYPSTMRPPVAGATKNAASDVIEGGFKAAEPLVAAAAVTNPVSTVVTLLATMAASKAAEQATAAAGASPETQRLAANVAGVIAGGAGTHEVIAEMGRKAKAFRGEPRAEAPPPVQSETPPNAAAPPPDVAGPRPPVPETPVSEAGVAPPIDKPSSPPPPDVPTPPVAPAHSPAGTPGPTFAEDLAAVTQEGHDAARQPSTTPMDVGEPSQHGETVGSGNAEGREVAGSQSADAETQPKGPHAVSEEAVGPTPGTLAADLDVLHTAPAPGAAEPTKLRDYSSTQINLTGEPATRLQALARSIPDEHLAENGREDTPHVTVKFGLHTNDVDAVRQVLADEGPIALTLGKTSMFPNGESGSGDVVKVDIDSPDLHRLNKKIADALPHTDTHPDYKPHATIAYVKAGEGERYVGRRDLEGHQVVADRIVFSDRAGRHIDIPLTGRQADVTTTVKPPKKEPRSVRAEPVEWHELDRDTQREVRRIHAEMDSIPYSAKNFNETLHRGGDFEISGGAGGAPVYWDIVGGNAKAGRPTFRYDRGDVADKVNAFITTGKRSVVSDLAVDVAKRRLANDRSLTRPSLPPQAGDEPGAVHVRRFTSLDAERAAVQDRAARAVEDDPAGMVARYRERFDNVVNADDAKELFDDYTSPAARTKNDLAVHRPASRLAQEVYERLVQEPVPEGRDPMAIFTAGGTGSGKSSALDAALPGIRERAHVVYDSTLTNLEAAEHNIRRARENGHEVLVVFSDRDVGEAFHATLERAREGGRPVTVNTHVATHTKAPDVFKELRQLFADDPAVTFVVTQHRTGARPELVDVDAWQGRDYNEADVRSRVEAIVAAEQKAGRLAPELVDALGPGARQPGAEIRADDAGRSEPPAEAVDAENVGGRAQTETVTPATPQPGDHVTATVGGHKVQGEVVEVVTAGKPGGTGDWRQRERARIRFTDPDTGRVMESFRDLTDITPARPATVDTLDTGEQQPRLPEAGAVRDVDTKTPAFEAPFSLERETDTTPRGRDQSLFDETPREMPRPGRRQDASGALAPSPASRALSLLKPGERQLRPSEIVRYLSKSLDELPIRVGKFKQHALGIYKPKEQTIRLKVANDLDTLAHEWGHHIHDSLFTSELPPKGFKGELLALGAPTSRSSYTVTQRLAEGQAEFTRLYLGDPAAARQRAPVYYAAFEQQLTHHPALQGIVQRAQRQYVGHLSQDPVTRGLSHMDFTGVDPTPKADVVTALQSAWIDDLYPVRRMVEDLADNQPIDIRRNGYALARLARGASAKADGFLRHGVRSEDGTFVATALEPALKPVRKQIKEFAGYLAGLRAVELRRRGMETGMSLEEARAIVAKYQSPEFDAARDAVYRYQDGLLQYAQRAGTLSADQLAAIKKLNRNYVPFQRVIDDVGGAAGAGTATLANKGLPVKRIKGSGRDIVNPLESIVRNTHALVGLVEQNRAMQALVDQARTTRGGGRYLEAIPEKQVATSFNLEQVAKHVREQLDDAGVDYPDNLDFDKVVTVFTPTQFRIGERGIVSVLHDGKREWFQVNDPALYDAISSIGPKSSDLLVNLFMRPARWLRAGATTTIGFIARNPIRDTLEAGVNSRYHFMPGVDTVRGLFEFARKGEDYQNFLNSGAGNSAMVGLDRNRIRQELAKMGASDRRRFADSMVLNPVNLLQALSEAMENATRLGEFKRGLATEGRTAEGYARAALAARDVTIDFARGGRVSKEWNRYTAFFNAGVQGTARLVEVFGRDPVGATLRATAAITVPSIALYALNHDDPTYRELPAWERNAYWHISLGRGPGHAWARVPKPFTLGSAFANLPEAALDYLETHDPEAIARILPDRSSAWHQLVAVMPTATMPALEVATNYDTFRARAIVNPSDTNLDTALQYNRWTSELAKFVGPRIGIAPAALDHLIYGYGGGLAGGAVNAVDRGAGAVGLLPASKPAAGLARAPLVSTFVRETPASDAQSLQSFYELRDRVEGAVGSIHRYEKTGDATKVQQRQEQARRDLGPDADATLKRVRAADKALAEVRDGVNQVFANRVLTPDEKKEILDRLYEQMVNVARTGLGKPALASQFKKPIEPALLRRLQKRDAENPLPSPANVRAPLPVAPARRSTPAPAPVPVAPAR